MPAERNEWRISLHGGHSDQYCTHGHGTLREVLDAAVAAGYSVFGVSEHVPRPSEYIFEIEQQKGYTAERLDQQFEAFAADIQHLAQEYSDRLTVLRGFEMEVVPDESYADRMAGYREAHEFDFRVGSLHYLGGHVIDGPRHHFDNALVQFGGLEELVLAYYVKLAEMVETLQPEVVAHLDLIKLNADGPVDTEPIRKMAWRALDAVEAHGGILDINTAGYRKGLGEPYPAPWIVEEARRRAIPFCFGDDSHGPEHVGTGIDAARQYLLELGVRSVTTLDREGDEIVRREIPLDSEPT